MFYSLKFSLKSWLSTILTVSPNLMPLGGRTLILVRIQQAFIHLAWYFQHFIHSNPFAEFDPSSFFSTLWLVCLGLRALSRVISLHRHPSATFRMMRGLGRKGWPCFSLVCYWREGWMMWLPWLWIQLLVSCILLYVLQLQSYQQFSLVKACSGSLEPWWVDRWITSMY